jgi:hypothetical protein
VFFLIFFSFFACEVNDKEKIGELVAVESVVFPARDFIAVNPAYTHLVESDSGSYLFAYNHVAENFQFINMVNGKVVKEVPLRFEGPNSVEGFTGATLTSLDSIWLIMSKPLRLSLLNFDGEIVLEKRIINDLVPLPLNFIILPHHTPLLQYGQKIFAPQPWLQGHHQITKEDLTKFQLVFSYDSERDTLLWYDIFYPENYWDKGKKLSDFSWTKAGNNLCIAPLYDHEIQIVDMKSGLLKERKQVKSPKINSFNYVDGMPSGMDEAYVNRIKADQYGGFFYDPHRQVYYRIFNPGDDRVDGLRTEELRVIDRSRPTTGVMVLDRELNILGEYIFEEYEIHSESNMFIGEKGLYLSLNNQNHPDFDEDHFRYKVVRFDVGE